jgi:hypothetical protein
MKKVCSKCLKGIMLCQCENYHPPILIGIDSYLASKLIEHYDSVGWISHTDWPDVHQFIKELTTILQDN